jgi:hypothetical protein
MLSAIGKKLQSIEKELSPFETRLLPVSKTFPSEAILDAYEYGYKSFGENRVQELLPKFEALPKDIDWHLIGHLQSNKVKYIASFISLIQSVDSEKLLVEIDKQALKAGRQISCLLQIYIANEETKFGWEPEEVIQFYQTGRLAEFKNIQIKGLMGMASNTSDQAQVRSEFRKLKGLFDALKAFDILPNSKMETLSMGMSGDYLLAAAEGSTMVRMGSSIFGAR